MKKVLVRLVVVFGCMLCATNISAKEKIKILESLPFSVVANVPTAVQNECRLGEKTSAFIEKYSKKSVERVSSIDSGKYLDMEITEVFAPGGGAWSGPKWMEVTGTLMDGDEAVASFRAKRFSTGGAFGGFKGTCSILGRCTKAIGKDIAMWLKNPVDEAELGDAK